VPRIIPEQPEILVRELLNVHRQPLVALPE
jgi:hypothetical protein